MSRLPSFFDLAGQYGATSAPSPSAGLATGGNVTQQLFSQELGRQTQLGAQGRAFGDAATRMRNLEDQFNSGIDFARGFETTEDVGKQFDILQRSTAANLASRGFFNSNLGATEQARVGEQKQQAIGDIQFRQQVEAAERAQETADAARLAELQKQLAALGAPPTAPTPPPAPPSAPTGPQHGERRQIGTAYGSPVYEYYNAQTGQWQSQSTGSRPSRLF